MSLRSFFICIVGLYCLITAQATIAARARSVCTLPPSLQAETSKKYPGTRLISQADLDERDRALFRKEHGARCPGLVSVDFYGDGKPTWALVLISEKRPERKVELVVAHEVISGWEFRSVDTTDGTPVVWHEGAGKYSDVYGEKTIQATHEVIVLCGYESWAILYAWTGTEIQKIWISD